MNQPYIHFFPRDWLAEFKLRMLAPADRGVWIDLLCLMSMAEPYGHLSNNGHPITDEEVCRILSMDIPTYKGVLKRLIDSGVCSVNGDGVVYSRRLVRDYEKRMAASEYGRRGGGNPALRGRKKKKSISNTNTISITRETIKGGFIDTYKGKTMSETEKKRVKVERNTPIMERIGLWFERKPATLWSVYEFEALTALGQISDEDMAPLENYYVNFVVEKDNDRRRRDVATLLNNWQSELDRARGWVKKRQNGIKPFVFEGDRLKLEQKETENADKIVE